MPAPRSRGIGEGMAGDDAGTGITDVHRGPARPSGPRRRPALVCAFPRPIAIAMPDSGTVLGRRWLAERELADREVSGEHLRLDRRGGRLSATDLGSRNGTWVNGRIIEAGAGVPLEDGDVVRLGRTLFVVREQLGALEPAPPIGELVGPFENLSAEERIQLTA